ncbi:MAG: hypothetical protein ACT4OM_10625 [Actinomycetota bacterium]
MKTFALTLVLVLSAACSEDGPPGPPEGSVPLTIDSLGAGDVIVRISAGGGFVPVEVNLAGLPQLTLYGDGRLIVQGPMIAIFPAPALPNLLVRRIQPAGVNAILEAARTAGLTGRNRNFDQASSKVTDLPTTEFVVATDAGTHTTSIYGIDFVQEVELSQDEREAVNRLLEFRELLTGLETFLPEGSLGPESTFDSEEIRVYVTEQVILPAEGDQPTGDELPQEPVAWPLATPLAAFGQPTQPEGYRCGTVQGEELNQFLKVARSANQLTPWTSQASSFVLVVRPLLPDESGCPSIQG